VNAEQRAALVEQVEDTIGDLEIEAATITEALATARRLLAKLRRQLEELSDLDAEESDEPEAR
jgi:hypothetical protein